MFELKEEISYENPQAVSLIVGSTVLMTVPAVTVITTTRDKTRDRLNALRRVGLTQHRLSAKHQIHLRFTGVLKRSKMPIFRNCYCITDTIS